METTFRFDSTNRRLKLHAKENFVFRDNWILTAEGALDAKEGEAEGKLAFRKKIFTKLLTRLRFGGSYASHSTGEGVVYNVGAKKSFEIAQNGLLMLDVKGDVDMEPKKRHVRPRGCCELSYKIYDFTENQDLKMKVGYSLGDKKWYSEIRENSWTIRFNKDTRWSVEYLMGNQF